jgi:hypothetical protein
LYYYSAMERRFWYNVARIVTIAGLTVGSGGCAVPVNTSPTGENNSPKSTEIASGNFGPIIYTEETIANLPDGTTKDTIMKRMQSVESLAVQIPGYLPSSVEMIVFNGPNGPFEYDFANIKENGQKKTVVVEYADKNKAEDVGGAELLAKKQADGSTAIYFNQGQNPISIIRFLANGSATVYDPTGTEYSTTSQVVSSIFSALFGYTVQGEGFPTPTILPTLQPTLIPTQSLAATTTLAETPTPKPQRFADTEYMITTNPETGQITAQSEYGGFVYGAEVVEVTNRPPILILTDPDWTKDLKGGRFALVNNKNAEAAKDGYTKAYLGAIAIAVLRGRGITNFTADDIEKEVEQISGDLTSGKPIEGATFTTPTGDKEPLTGQPLIIMMSKYHGYNPNWVNLVGGGSSDTGFSFKIDATQKYVIINILLTPAYGGESFDSWGVLTSEQESQFHAQENFAEKLIWILKVLGGVNDPKDIPTESITINNSPTSKFLIPLLDPGFSEYYYNWLTYYEPTINKALTYGTNSEQVAEALGVKGNYEYSARALITKYLDQSFIRIAGGNP